VSQITRQALAAIFFLLVTAGLLQLSGLELINIEESRVSQAIQVLGLDKMHVGQLAEDVQAADNIGDKSAAKIFAAHSLGKAHWDSAKERLRSTASFDDRPLYWQRLAEKKAFRQACAGNDNCMGILEAYEWASRGADDLDFRADSDLRIVLSGFDPFLLDLDIQQSNPSGVAALLLDGLIMDTSGIRAEIQTVLIPVRFADFDSGRIEDLFGPLIVDNKIDVLITLSMGRNDFDLERFPGRRRSAEVPGNQYERTGATLENPLVPMLGNKDLPGPEYVEFSLPVDALLTVQSPFKVHDNRTVTTLERGEFEAGSLSELKGQTAVRGSGGGYLSNEISYRTVRLVREYASPVQVGHIHTPRIQGFDRRALNSITDQIRAMLQALVEA